MQHRLTSHMLTGPLLTNMKGSAPHSQSHRGTKHLSSPTAFGTVSLFGTQILSRQRQSNSCVIHQEQFTLPHSCYVVLRRDICDNGMPALSQVLQLRVTGWWVRTMLSRRR